MRKRARILENPEEINVWPSFTDLIANAFMILNVLLLLALFRSWFLKSTAEQTQLSLSATEQQVRILEQEIASRNSTIGVLSSQNQQLRNELGSSRSFSNELEQTIERLRLAPPVVVIQDSGEFQFDSGSAQLPGGLKRYISTNLVPKIEKIVAERNIYTVEIIGHTDGQINANVPSNLDQKLEDVATGKSPINSLSPGSNADLGLMRALEVVKQLQQEQKRGRLQGVEFRAYSAAQLFLPSGAFSPVNRNPDKNRRRIEIRFSPLGKAETVR